MYAVFFFGAVTVPVAYVALSSFVQMCKGKMCVCVRSASGAAVGQGLSIGSNQKRASQTERPSNRQPGSAHVSGARHNKQIFATETFRVPRRGVYLP